MHLIESIFGRKKKKDEERKKEALSDLEEDRMRQLESLQREFIEAKTDLERWYREEAEKIFTAKVTQTLWECHCPKCSFTILVDNSTIFLRCLKCGSSLRVVKHVGDRRIMAVDLIIRYDDESGLPVANNTEKDQQQDGS